MEEYKFEHNNESNLTLTDVIRSIRKFAKEIWRKWYLIIPFIMAVGAYYARQHQKEGIKYPAGITFIVNEEEGDDPTGGIGSLLKAFSGKGGKDGHALEKVLQLFRSRSIVEKSLFHKIAINGKEDYLSNHIISIYGLEKLYSAYNDQKWLKPIRDIKNFTFKHNDIEKFTPEETLILLVIYEAVSGNESAGVNSMILPTLDDRSNIMRFGATTDSPELTVGLLEAIYAQLTQFYLDETVTKQSLVYNIVKKKQDSIRAELASADASLAKFEDSNRNLVWVAGELAKVKLQRQARVLEAMYVESVKQLEMADFALRRKIPFIKVVDRPRLPLRAVKMSIGRSAMISVMIGTILGIFFIVLRKVILDAMRKLKEMEDREAQNAPKA